MPVGHYPASSANPEEYICDQHVLLIASVQAIGHILVIDNEYPLPGESLHHHDMLKRCQRQAGSLRTPAALQQRQALVYRREPCLHLCQERGKPCFSQQLAAISLLVMEFHTRMQPLHHTSKALHLIQALTVRRCLARSTAITDEEQPMPPRL